MKYAIYADIHGNAHALKAALADAEAQDADMHLFTGDYTYGCPWGNEVINIIKSINNAVSVRGNGEDNFIKLLNSTDTDWDCEQMKLLYWAYRSFSDENKAFIKTLPKTAEIPSPGGTIRIAHKHHVIYRNPRLDYFHSSYFGKQMKIEPISHDEYLIRGREAILSRPDAASDVMALPKGVYIFGHNHLQFYSDFKGRLFINPGSCGEALDWNTTATYTLLEWANNHWMVTERRVAYDLEATVDAVRASAFYAYSPAWAELIIKQQQTGNDCYTPFLTHLWETGTLMGNAVFPVGNDVWQEAVKTWKYNKL
jgi:predicted phosphodiesterase